MIGNQQIHTHISYIDFQCRGWGNSVGKNNILISGIEMLGCYTQKNEPVSLSQTIYM